jgi:hypothetical protein
MLAARRRLTPGDSSEPLDWDYSCHDAHVVLTTPYKVQLEFDATYTVDAESVEDFVFSGATLLR